MADMKQKHKTLKTFLFVNTVEKKLHIYMLNLKKEGFENIDALFENISRKVKFAKIVDVGSTSVEVS